jgi:SAM-dependent methyltransferase
MLNSAPDHFRSPLHFAASLTADFVAGMISDHNVEILDVGCGDGLIAADLTDRGFKVTAIDSNFEAAERARKNGVPAIHKRLDEYAAKSGTRYGCILVSRALHHLPPVAEAVAQLATLLDDGGKLLIEDFAYEKANARACNWLFEKAAECPENTVASGGEPGHRRHAWLRQKPENADAAKRIFSEFYQGNKHILTGEAMQAALAERFSDDIPQEGKSYLFRYICDFLPATTKGADAAAAVWAEETALLAAGLLPAIGFRQVLSKRA